MKTPNIFKINHLLFAKITASTIKYFFLILFIIAPLQVKSKILIDTGPPADNWHDCHSFIFAGSWYQPRGAMIEISQEVTISSIEISGYLSGSVTLRLYSGIPDPLYGMHKVGNLLFSKLDYFSEPSYRPLSVPWVAFSDLNWKVLPGIYWIYFVSTEEGDFGRWCGGAPNPLREYITQVYPNSRWFYHFNQPDINKPGYNSAYWSYGLRIHIKSPVIPGLLLLLK